MALDDYPSWLDDDLGDRLQLTCGDPNGGCGKSNCPHCGACIPPANPRSLMAPIRQLDAQDLAELRFREACEIECERINRSSRNWIGDWS